MRWKIECLVDRSEEPASIPAYRFLKALPVNVRVQLLAILAAVQTTGPDQWADRHSHSPMKGDLADLHEVRDKQGETLYRLFVLWQRRACSPTPLRSPASCAASTPAPGSWSTRSSACQAC